MKNLSKIFLAVSMLTMSAMATYAQTVTADNVTGAEGKTVNLAINLNNDNVQITTMGVDVYLPKGVTVEKDGSGDLIINPSSRKADHVFAGAVQADGAYRFLVYSNNNRTFSGTEGVLFTVPIKLDAAPGAYEIQLKNIEVVDPEFTQINPADFTATLTITDPENYGENQLYVKNITISQGDNATMYIGYNSDSDVYEYRADIVLPSGVTVESLTFNPVVSEVANYTNNWSFDAPALKIDGVYGGGRKDVPAEEGDHIIASVVINTSALAPGTYTITVNNQFIDNDNTLNPEAYEAKLIVSAGQINLIDGTEYTNATDMACTAITYTRTFPGAVWQALYVPFDMDYADWAELGDVAVLDDASNDGENATISFRTLTSGTLEANTPCIFKPKASGETVFKVSNATLKAAPATDPSISRPIGSPFVSVYGNYEVKTGLAALGAFALSAEGQFVKAATPEQTLNPYRIYVLLDTSHKAPSRIGVIVDGETSGIEDIIIMQQTDGRYYDLLGRPAENPQPGIYILDGKKVILK